MSLLDLEIDVQDNIRWGKGDEGQYGAQMKEWLRTYHPNIMRILQLLRYEFRSGVIHFIGKISPRQRALLYRLKRSCGLKINLCGGKNKYGGWLNIDILPIADIRMDVRRPLPLRDQSVSLIFSEHFLDHLHFPHEISRLLAECYRVLQSRGRIRFILHDGCRMMDAYLKQDAHYFEFCDDCTRMIAINRLFHGNQWRHFLYDYETFEMLLKQVGFSSVLRCRYRESECLDLVLDCTEPHRESMSMYIEAVKQT